MNLMDIFFQDPTDIPLPPDEVRIRRFRAEPWPDNRRVRIYLELTPFQKRPNGEIQIADAPGNEVANLSIIETIDPKMDFTVHLRADEIGGQYLASATVYYYEEEPPNPEGENGEPENRPAQLPSQIKIVDEARTVFEIPASSPAS